MEQQTLVKTSTEFRCLLLDPPWNETGGQGGSWGESKRGADRHYPLLKTRRIPDVVRRSGLWRPTSDAHVWMWVTDNFLQDGLWVLRVLGFRYVRTMVWVKAEDEEQLAAGDVQIGLGKYLRGSHELCLFGVYGRGLHLDVRGEAKNVPSVVYGRRTRHSQKPGSSYDTIEKVSNGPRIEFFARSERPGWVSWGNEVSV